MIRALFKKQMMEAFSGLRRGTKLGKVRGRTGTVLFAVLYAFVFVILAFAFFALGQVLCPLLAGMGKSWLYIVLMGLLSIMLGVFGSVFASYSSLYQAKDNDLLLSMPIPASRILLIRMSGVYVLGLLFELIALVPALVVHFIYVPLKPLAVVFCVLLPILLSFFVLTLSCALGWVVALVSSRVKNAKFFTVILSLAFLAAYYYVYYNASALLQTLVANLGAAEQVAKTALFPLYHMGLAAGGNVLSMLIFSAIVLVLFALAYTVLSRSFFRLVTSNRGVKKAKYVEKRYKNGSVAGALLRKEFRRFLNSPVYMLNCGLGLIFMLGLAVFALVKKGTVTVYLRLFMRTPVLGDILPLVLLGAVCMLACMNDMTAPSVSLEGKHIWLLQALPVPGRKALFAKLNMHMALCLLPTLVLSVCGCIVLQVRGLSAVLVLIGSVLFSLFIALWGLFLNLKRPNLNWSTETAPVKQSMSVSLTLLGGWVVVLALGALYIPLMRFVSATAYLAAVTVLFAAIDVLLLLWVRTRGAEIFERLAA